jgi:pimeloyl-ACP methyl ester carboxylesterase
MTGTIPSGEEGVAERYYAIQNAGHGLALRECPGPGAGVLWLHPYALDSSAWGELWEALPGWRHVGLDLPGHGASLPLAREDDLGGVAHRLLRVARERGLHHVVGLSFGSLVALQMAIEEPEALGSLVLGSPLLADGSFDEVLGRRYRELVNMQRIGGFGEFLRGRLMDVEPSVFEGARSRPGLWERLRTIVGRHPFWDLADGGYLRLVESGQNMVQVNWGRTPLLVVVGGKERREAKRAAKKILQARPDARRVDIVGVGHLSLLEAPMQAARAIEEHLKAHAAGEGRGPGEAVADSRRG